MHWQRSRSRRSLECKWKNKTFWVDIIELNFILILTKDLDGSQLTISPSRWMELPDMSYADWKRQLKVNMNAGLVFSSKTNFSEDSSLLNANYTHKPTVSPNTSRIFSHRQMSPEESRVTMHDVKLYYRDYAKQKNLDKYLLNSAMVTNVRRIYCTKLANTESPCMILPISNHSASETDASFNAPIFWEVTGLIDKRDRKKASSLTHKGDLTEFKFFCKHLVLANGTTDLHNELHVKGESQRFILRTIRELEEKIKEDLPRLQKDPLMIIGSGLSAADAILLAQKYSIRIVHVIRRSVHDQNLIFNKLPKKIYPEYQRVYEQMVLNRYTNLSNNYKNENLSINGENGNVQESISNRNYVLYDEYSVKSFSSKRVCILNKINPMQQQSSLGHDEQQKSVHHTNINRHLNLQRHHHQIHQRQLKEFDEDAEMNGIAESIKMSANLSDKSLSGSKQYPINGNDSSFNNKNNINNTNSNTIELKISYACILIGFSPNLDFFAPILANDMALDSTKSINSKDNPIAVDRFTHEALKFKNLYAMGPLIGDNFIRFGTGGALAITSSIVKFMRMERQQQQFLTLNPANSISLPSIHKKKELQQHNKDSNNNSSVPTGNMIATISMLDLKPST